MSTYELILESPVCTDYRSQRAANSLDIDVSKNARHHFSVDADLDTPFNVGLIVGASGSGKTTLAHRIWGDQCFRELLDTERPIIEQFPTDWTYDDCVSALNGVGLTQVPCWIRPALTLSNGQRARAEIALQLAYPEEDGTVVIDEWTSVVDRTVAKVMSWCVAKHARKTNRRMVLLSCHYDVVEWLNPDWVIDCNDQSYVDRRLVQRRFKRKEKLDFQIRVCDRRTWHLFSKYHYLSDKLPGGTIKTFGLYHGENQIGFQCFANYTPTRLDDKRMKMHSNRTVIHPDYAGFGLGIVVINKTSEIMHRAGYDVWAKFSSAPVFRAMSRDERWDFVKEERKMKTIVGGNMYRTSGFRTKVRTFTFKYVPDPDMDVQPLDV